jgi:hypothetical protein
MTFGSLITPGYGGRAYFSTGKGFIVLQVRPKPASPGKCRQAIGGATQAYGRIGIWL